MPLFTPPLADLNTWLTPVWLVSVGAAAGLVILGVLYGLAWLVARRHAVQIPGLVREGGLAPIFYVVVFLAGVAVVASLRMPVREMFGSVSRMFSVGEIAERFEIEAGAAGQELPVAFRAQELARYEITSDQDVVLATRVGDLPPEQVLEVLAGEPRRWNRSSGEESAFLGSVRALEATTESAVPATLTLRLITDVEYPEVYCVPVVALSVVVLFVVYVLSRFWFPKVTAIAATTSRQAASQPVFYLALAIGAFALLAFVYVPYNTFGEDVKMLKDSGLTLIMILAILVALWTASVSVADEIEGRTALTLLSKPIGRRQFILGKFLGIVWPLVTLFVVLGVLFMITVSFKVVYDAREAARMDVTWAECYREMVSVVPGLLLAFMETVLLASISVAISTRLPMLANLIICATVYVLGHLVPMLVESSVAQFQIVHFVGLLIATIFPVLDHFNTQAAVAAGAAVPLTYLLWALLYCLLYSGIMMLLALALFEDRDLA